MSDFKFSCPNCSQSIVCDTSNAGMQIPCPSCQTLLTVPRPQPAAPAVPTSGKLSINKAAHQSHAAPPPPGAAHAPAKPVWGAKPPPPAPKKKSPLVSILVGCVTIAALLAVAWFSFGASYFKERAQKKQMEADMEKARQEEARKAAEEAAKPKPPKPVWKLDLADAQIPDAIASGKEHGVNFTLETAVFQNNSLTLRQAGNSPRQFIISLPLKPGETPAGKTFEVTPTNATGQPHIMLNWKDDGAKLPGGAAFSKGYAMKLAFDNSADGNLSGKIYLCIPDPEQSFVAGNFKVGPKTPTAVQPVAAPGMNADPRTRRAQQR